MTFSRAMVAGRDLLVSRNNQQSRLVVGTRIHPVPIPPAWRQRVGRYEILDLPEDEVFVDRLRLSVQDEFLVVTGRVTKPKPVEFAFALEPLSDTEAVVMGLGFGSGETVEVLPQAGEETLTYSGHKLKKISKN